MSTVAQIIVGNIFMCNGELPQIVASLPLGLFVPGGRDGEIMGYDGLCRLDKALENLILQHAIGMGDPLMVAEVFQPRLGDKSFQVVVAGRGVLK